MSLLLLLPAIGILHLLMGLAKFWICVYHDSSYNPLTETIDYCSSIAATVTGIGLMIMYMVIRSTN